MKDIEKVIKIISTIFIFIFVLFLVSFFFKNGTTTVMKLFLTPFIACGLCTFGYVLSSIFEDDAAANVFLKGYAVIFLVVWFGLITFFVISMFNSGNQKVALFSIPFYIFGLLIIYNYFIK